MRLEITINRIGGDPGPRHFTTTQVINPTAGITWQQDVMSTDDPSYWLRLGFKELIPAQDDFVSCLARLDLIDGQPVATRPVLIYDQPCDVPVWSTFQHPGAPDLGVFSVGFRRVL